MKNRFLLMFLVSIVCGPAASAHAQSAFEKIKAAAALDKTDLRLPPTNAFELLKNIKYAIDAELFLDDSFFETENLLLFTNARYVEGLGTDKNWLMIRQANIEGVTRSIQANRQNTEDEKMGRLAINFLSPQITADYIIKVIGPLSKTVDPYKNFDRGHSMPLSAKTHQFGNLEICRLIVSQKVNTEVCSLVSGNGQVSQFNVVQTKEK